MKPIHVAFTMALTLGLSLIAGADTGPITKDQPTKEPAPGLQPADPALDPSQLPGTKPTPLKTRPPAGKAAPVKPIPPLTLEERIAALEADNAALRQIIKQTGTTVTIVSKGQLVLVSDGALTANAGAAVTLNAGTNLVAKAAATAELKAAGTVKLTGSTVKVNETPLP
jgi:hypothetical protein